MEVNLIPISTIDEGDRVREDYGDMAQLKNSIEQQGLIQPIAVERTATELYKLLAGGRRLRCCKLLKYENIPARIYTDLTEQSRKVIELTENIERKDMTWNEIVLVKKQIHDLQISIHGEKVSKDPAAPGWSKRDTSELLGEAPSHTSTDIMIAEAMEIIPGLSEQKTRADALKMVQRTRKKLENQQTVTGIEKQTATDDISKVRRAISDRYIIKDVLLGMQNVATNSVDMIEMDPPYGIDLTSQKRGGDTSAYNEVAAASYEAWFNFVLKECHRVLHPNGWIICWFGPDPWYSMVVSSLADNGFMFPQIPGIWTKPTGQTMDPKHRLANCYEMFFYARISNYAEIRTPGVSNVMSYKPVNPTDKTHPTERPIEMIEELIKRFSDPGQIVLSPFLGSGNTILAATNTHRHAMGFDLSIEYKNAFTVRVNQSRPGEYKSYA